MAEVAAAAGQGAAVVVVAPRSLCRRRRRYQTLPCSERLREESVTQPARSRRSQYARRGALASHTLPFIAGATCGARATNQGRGPLRSAGERGRKSASGGRHCAAAAAGVNRLMNGGVLLCGGGGRKGLGGVGERSLRWERDGRGRRFRFIGCRGWRR